MPQQLWPPVRKAKPQAVVIALSGEVSGSLVTRLRDACLGGTKLWLASDDVVDYSMALPDGLMTGVRGVVSGGSADDAFLSRLRTSDLAVADARHAAEAYGAVVLVALAAVVAGDDGGASIVGRVADVSTDGIPCSSFGECLDVLSAEGDIDYEGVSGPLEIDSSDDPLAGRFSVVEYAGDNRSVPVDELIVGR